MDLNGKTAIVTGASRGIGFKVAARLAKEGVSVVIAARDQETLNKAVEDIKAQSASGVKVIGVATDVAKLSDLENLYNVAKKEFGHLDILVNNAGVSSQYPFEKQPIDDLERLVMTNYLGYVRLIRLAINDMIQRKQGAIINMVSGSTLCDPVPRGFVTYSSIKVGLKSFLKGLFWEMRDHGIKITSILPGVVDTDLTGKLQDITSEEKERLMSADTVVDMVMFALSVPQNACPLELAVINQKTPWTRPVIDFKQQQAK
ncbi:MAG: SDR family oxidoreductase [Candidatus Omnitrophica bacterium]|nr:SDR family oxidoreductase [Candidatus Omnitrophota bacterium]